MIELLSEHECMATVESYFGFRETPFGVTPDPRFFYSSSLYLEGLAALVYGIRGKEGSHVAHGGGGNR
jgi:general secretion pathway protein A